MRTKIRCIASLATAIAVSGLVGCQSPILHELKPHRMWRWNRGSPAPRDAYFSVSDPIPANWTVSEAALERNKPTGTVAD